MSRTVTVAIVIVIGVLALAAGGWWRASTFRPIDHTRRASVLAANFHNFGTPSKAPHVFHPSGDPGDPVRTFFWTQVDALERGVLDVFAEAQQRSLDGSRQAEGRLAALDLIFASTHSARVATPGPDGVRVGRVETDRTLPSPARAGMLAVFTKLAESQPARFRGVRVQTVFLLNCGSVQDTGDARILDRAIRAMTGAPPARILSTSDQVNPDYRDVCAGMATGIPIVIYDSRPGGEHGTEPRAVPWLQIGRDGTFHFGTGAGRHLSVIPPGR